MPKSFDSWDRQDDVQGENELMVTITLHEYRDLVKHYAVADDRHSKLQMELYKAQEENRKLKDRIARLTMEEENA